MSLQSHVHQLCVQNKVFPIFHALASNKIYVFFVFMYCLLSFECILCDTNYLSYLIFVIINLISCQALNWIQDFTLSALISNFFKNNLCLILIFESTFFYLIWSNCRYYKKIIVILLFNLLIKSLVHHQTDNKIFVLCKAACFKYVFLGHLNWLFFTFQHKWDTKFLKILHLKNILIIKVDLKLKFLSKKNLFIYVCGSIK